MIVKSVVNEEALQAMGIHLVGYKQRVLIAVLGVLLAVYAVWGITHSEYGRVIFAVLFEAVLAVEFVIIQRRTVKFALNRLEETWGLREISIMINFTGRDSFVLENSENTASDKQKSMEYSCLAKLREKNGYAFLWTKALQYFAFPLDQFEEEAQKYQFYDLLKKQAPNIKMKVK